MNAEKTLGVLIYRSYDLEMCIMIKKFLFFPSLIKALIM